MDQRQEELVSSIKNDLAASVMATEFAEYLQIYKLLGKDEVDNILRAVESNFARNLRLLDAAQESNLSTAFEDLVKVLERVDPYHATKLSSLSNKIRAEKVTSSRGFLGQFWDKCTKSPNCGYPLGMKSGISKNHQSPSYRSTGGSSSFPGNDNGQTTSSPYKERHQATLICSASGSSDRSQQETQLPNQQPSTTDNGYRLPLRYPNGQLPVTPPTVNHKGQAVMEGDRTGLRNMNKFSQTPTRPQESTRLNNLSLTEEDEEEPIVCWHPYAQQGSASGASSPHRCYSSASSESGESSSDSLIIDNNFIRDSDVMSAIARDGPIMMLVKEASQCHNNSEEDYKMTARPRGKCLIVNNINFEDDIFPTRKGSDEDANRFDQIFKQLGFETIISRNLTADQMRDKFKELSAACKPEHDALFVFILSHGSEHGIYGTDGLEVYLDSEIISCFDNRNCKAMIGKPKVFVIQACRGRSKDCGGDGDTTDSIPVSWAPGTPGSEARTASQENRVPPSWLPSNQQSDGKRRKHPIRTDMLLVFSCLAGAAFGTNLKVMAECIMRKATGNDADELYDLIIESTSAKIGLTREEFRKDLAGVYELTGKDIDKHLSVPNCPVCQAFLAISGNQLVGYVLFHYHYSPWSSRSVFIDDIYVRQSYRRRGIAKNLLRKLSELCKRQNLAAMYFNSTNMSQELLDKAKNYQTKVVRDNDTDWSVYRIEFKG